MALDPVCKMDVDEASAKYTAEYKGKTYYFCAPGVQETLRARPRGVPEGIVTLFCRRVFRPAGRDRKGHILKG